MDPDNSPFTISIVNTKTGESVRQPGMEKLMQLLMDHEKQRSSKSNEPVPSQAPIK